MASRGVKEGNDALNKVDIDSLVFRNSFFCLK